MYVHMYRHPRCSPPFPGLSVLWKLFVHWGIFLFMYTCWPSHTILMWLISRFLSFQLLQFLGPSKVVPRNPRQTSFGKPCQVLWNHDRLPPLVNYRSFKSITYTLIFDFMMISFGLFHNQGSNNNSYSNDTVSAPCSRQFAKYFIHFCLLISQHHLI